MRLTVLILSLFILNCSYSQTRKEIVNSDYSFFIDPSGINRNYEYLQKLIYVDEFKYVSTNRFLTFGFQKKISEKKFILIPVSIPLNISYKKGEFNSAKNTSLIYYYYYYHFSIPMPVSEDTLHANIGRPCIGTYCKGVTTPSYYRKKDLLLQSGISIKLYPFKRKKLSYFTQFSFLTGLINIYQFDYYHSFIKNSNGEWKFNSETKKISNDIKLYFRPEITNGMSIRLGQRFNFDMQIGICSRMLFMNNKTDKVYIRFNDSEYTLIYKLSKKDVFGTNDEEENFKNIIPFARFSIYYNFNWKKDE